MKTVDIHGYAFSNGMSEIEINKLQALWENHNFGISEVSGGKFTWCVYGHTGAGEYYELRGESHSVESAINNAHAQYGHLLGRNYPGMLAEMLEI
jgi:hypothetical protein